MQTVEIENIQEKANYPKCFKSASPQAHSCRSDCQRK
ncbi:hypothetical protein CEXT_519451, partial [Caerostris extrusa]